jgi:hypothetical protein
MIPVAVPDAGGDPLHVTVEEYGFLPVDRAAFIGLLPDVDGLVPYTPFTFYEERKLYLHNMGHAICAYLGLRHGCATIDQAVGNPFVRIGDVFAYEWAGREGALYIIDRQNNQGTIETITSEMVGTTQHFTLKPMGSVTATLVGSDNKPMANTHVSLRYTRRLPQHVNIWGPTHGETDAEGRVTLPVLSGTTSVALNLPGTLSEQMLMRHGHTTSYSLDKELDLAPGENFDFGTIRLVRVFGTMGTGRGNVQINGMDAPDSPQRDDRRAVTNLWADENGEYDMLLPTGHYRFGSLTIINGRSVDYVLSISEDSKDIQLDFDAEGKGTMVQGL